MASVLENDSSTQYFESLRNYVLSPLATALGTLERERAEIDAERHSFEQFIERVEGIECQQPQLHHASDVGGSQTRRLEDVREAYRETVMAVEHYDEVYGNALQTDVKAEFGSEIAAALYPSTDLPFTEHTRDFIVAAAERSVEQRAALLKRLAEETQSLERAREEVGEVVRGLDGARIPHWHADAFLTHIDTLAADRQRTIESWQPPGFTDGHQLCEYLYDTEPWSYPVLTAIARLRRTTEVQQQ